MACENKLGTEKISKLVFQIALPSMLAQFISVLYSIVDRIFVGNIQGVGDLSLSGIGVCAPIITMITAFAFLIGIGGSPLLGIALGERNKEKAEHILANAFVMLIGIGVIVTILMLSIKNPMLRLFGASENTFEYANTYFTICVSGTIFALLATGLYQYVLAQGYSKTAMAAVMSGAITNVILDPIFIYVFKLGIAGAAYATIISQFISSTILLIFLLTKTNIKITFKGYDFKTMLNIIKLGLSPFVIILLDNVVLIAFNSVLQAKGGVNGDLLISVNTIVQSFMLVVTMPLGGISGGTQCILSYNYGSGDSKRVISAQKYIFLICVMFTTIMFLIAQFLSPYFVALFSSDTEVVAQSVRAIKITSLFIIPLGLQYAIVDGFTAMGQVKIALSLSLWRKLIYFTGIFVIPMIADIFFIFYSEVASDIISILVSFPIWLVLTRKVLEKRRNFLKENVIIKKEI